MVRREPVGEAGVAAVHRQGVLGEVVGADAEERADLGQAVRDEHRGGRFDHHTDRQRFGGAEHRAHLRPEHRRLVETHADRAPAEKRIGLERRLEPHRELVASQIIGADHDRIAVKRGGDAAEVVGLLVLGRQRGAAGEQELGAEQPDALGAHPHRRLDLLRQVHVAHQYDGAPAGRDRGRVDHRLELQLEPVAPADLGLRLLQLVARGVEHDGARLPVEQHHHAGRDRGQRARGPHHRGNAQRVREDGRVSGPGALLADEADHVLAVELDREARRELVGHDDHLLVVRDRPELVPHPAHEAVEHPELNGVEVGDLLAEHRGAREQIAVLERLELVRGLGAQVVVADQRLDRGEEVGVLRHLDLRVEDAGLLGAGPLQHALAELAQVLDDVPHRLAQPRHLRVDLIGTDRAVGHLGKVHPHDERGRARDPGRDADAAERARHLTVSPNPLCTSAASASTACSASGPSARMRIELPHSAASIMTPMMLLPFTSMPSLHNSMSDANVLASRTICAAGRAWSPSWFTMVACRSITGPSGGRGAAGPSKGARSGRR
jgi:hypothetical protein